MTNTIAIKDPLARNFSSEIQSRGLSPLQSLSIQRPRTDVGAIEIRLTQLANIAFMEFKSQRGEVLLI